MNLFTQYGIKEVANVTFYSIITVGDEEFYLPVLFLDTLKVSDIEEKTSKVTASSGYGNVKRIGWSFGRDITLKLQDALFTPASMSMTAAGWLDQRFSKFVYAAAKLLVTEKYYRMHYSPKAFPSPKLTPEELDVIYFLLQNLHFRQDGYWSPLYDKNQRKIEQNRAEFLKGYYERTTDTTPNVNNYQSIAKQVFNIIDNYSKFSSLTTNLHNVEIVDRMEKCEVKDEQFEINVAEQKENLKKYLLNDNTNTYSIFYDINTLAPLVTNANVGQSRIITLRRGQKYLKWTRYIKHNSNMDNGTLGQHIIINTDTFPNYFKIVGETMIREQKTGKDQAYQFVINKAKLNSDTNITLEAAGDPTIFDLSVQVIAPKNDIMMELKQFDIQPDCASGGTRIVPQRADFSQTFIDTTTNQTNTNDIIVDEVY